MMSEHLIKPLIETMKHQHAKVRVEAVNALGKDCEARALLLHSSLCAFRQRRSLWKQQIRGGVRVTVGSTILRSHQYSSFGRDQCRRSLAVGVA